MKNLFKSEEPQPWWVILLKAIVYIIGLILGGIGTMASAQMLGIIKPHETTRPHEINMRATQQQNNDGQNVCSWPTVSNSSMQTSH